MTVAVFVRVGVLVGVAVSDGVLVTVRVWVGVNVDVGTKQFPDTPSQSWPLLAEPTTQVRDAFGGPQAGPDCWQHTRGVGVAVIVGVVDAVFVIVGVLVTVPVVVALAVKLAVGVGVGVSVGVPVRVGVALGVAVGNSDATLQPPAQTSLVEKITWPQPPQTVPQGHMLRRASTAAPLPAESRFASSFP